MCVGNFTTVNDRSENTSEYHQVVLSVKIERLEDPDAPLRDDRLSDMTSLRA